METKMSIIIIERKGR